MTGLTPALKDDFKAMREIRSITMCDAPVKVKECLKLFQTIMNHKVCRQKIEEMDFKFIDQPLKV